MAARNEHGERVFTGRHMLIVMVCFFATVIGVNLVMATLASRSWTGLVVPNSYVASQHFNELLEQAEAQKALGWTPSLDLSDGRLVFTLVDRSGRPVHVTDVRATVRRPTHERSDRTIDLVPTAHSYEAEATLAPGVWNAEVTARRADGGAYRSLFRLVARTRE